MIKALLTILVMLTFANQASASPSREEILKIKKFNSENCNFLGSCSDFNSQDLAPRGVGYFEVDGFKVSLNGNTLSIQKIGYDSAEHKLNTPYTCQIHENHARTNIWGSFLNMEHGGKLMIVECYQFLRFHREREGQYYRPLCDGHIFGIYFKNGKLEINQGAKSYNSCPALNGGKPEEYINDVIKDSIIINWQGRSIKEQPFKPKFVYPTPQFR